MMASALQSQLRAPISGNHRYANARTLVGLMSIASRSHSGSASRCAAAEERQC